MPSNRFADEVFPGLPGTQARHSLHMYLLDEETSPKKYTRTISFATTPEMYQALQELAAHKDLPFQGSMATLERHATASFILAVEEFLDDDMRTIFRSLMTQQRRLTRERIIVTIDEVIDQQVEQLRFWTHRSKWNEVKRGLDRFLVEVSEYPTNEWREHAADVWLHHDGVRNLMRLWAGRLAEEAPNVWQVVRTFTDKLEEYAGV